MSATNAISGISLIGHVSGGAGTSRPAVLGSVPWHAERHSQTVVRGFSITDRTRSSGKRLDPKAPTAPGQMTFSSYFMEATYLLASILFVLALKGMSHPETARHGMFLAEAGMLAAILGTLVGQHIVTWVWIIAGLTLGSAIGGWMAVSVPTTRAAPTHTTTSTTLLSMAISPAASAPATFGGLAAAVPTASGLTAFTLASPRTTSPSSTAGSGIPMTS